MFSYEIARPLWMDRAYVLSGPDDGNFERSGRIPRLAGRQHSSGRIYGRAGDRADRSIDVSLANFRIGIERPIATLHHVTDHDAVTAWADARSHGAIRRSTEGAVLYFRLRNGKCKLAINRNHLVVIKQRLRAQARAINDYRLRKGHQIAWGVELADYDFPPEENELSHELIQID